MGSTVRVLPEFFRVRQNAVAPPIADIESQVRSQVRNHLSARPAGRGASIAITAGSRGIASLAEVLRVLVDELRSAGYAPFIVPAMGSHGGATADGQRRVLATMGIDERTVNAEIRSSMETAELGRTDSGLAVHMDRCAAEADRVILVNRIAPHPEFYGSIQSGLMKMAVFGLGKHRGAAAYHDAVTRKDFETVVRDVFSVVQERSHLWFGMGLLENQAHQIHRVEIISGEMIFERESGLLRVAQSIVRRLPFDRVHVLVVDSFGKDISGSGMDLGIVGRKNRLHDVADNAGPWVKRIVVRELSTRTYGNATGLGLADFAHRRVVDAIDRESTYTNCLTANGPIGGAIPMNFESDRELLLEAIGSVGLDNPHDARIVWIRNTADMETCLVSQAYGPELRMHRDLQTLEHGILITFDAEGQLVRSPLDQGETS